MPALKTYLPNAMVQACFLLSAEPRPSSTLQYTRKIRVGTKNKTGASYHAQRVENGGTTSADRMFSCEYPYVMFNG